MTSSPLSAPYEIVEPLCLSLGQLTLGDPWRLELSHDRPHHMLIWITRGQGRATVLGQRRGVSAHNALFVPAGTLMSLAMGPQSFGHAVLLPEAMGLNWPRLPTQLRVRDVLAHGEFTGLIEGLQREIAKPGPHREQALTAHAMLISVWFRRQFNEFQVEDKPTAAQALVMKYADLVSETFRYGPTVAELAEQLNVTPTHLTRSCRSCAGKTAAELLTERIVYEARMLLDRPGIKAREVSDHLNFGSPAYFSRFILQHTGKSPSALRKAVGR